MELHEIVRKTPNRGRVHLFLGDPASVGCDKTTVEPGNVTSPGVWTCGISVWFWRDDGTFVSSELLDDKQIDWTLDTSDGPVITSQYGDATFEVIHRTCHLAGEGAHGCDFHEVTARLDTSTPAIPCIVVRDVGPAGAKIASLEWQDDALLINGGIRVSFGNQQATCKIFPPDAENDSPLAIVYLTRAAGATVFNYRVEHAFPAHPAGTLQPIARPFAQVSCGEAFAQTRTAWRDALPARIFAPDARIAATWERCAYHILAAMECKLPRISAVNYPHLWLRDGVIVLRALDLFGRHDLALAGAQHIAPILFSGGFGAEADAPGQAIWCLVRHAVITKNQAFLRAAFPLIHERVLWIEKMRRADRPLYAVGQNRIPAYTDVATINTLCLPAQNGAIHGRMDWHAPDFFINCWSISGLALAAEAASWLGHQRLADEWLSAARELESAVVTHLLPNYGNDRDPAITPHPSGALLSQRATLREKFAVWYHDHRTSAAGKRRAEPLWTYFEAAQIHNAFLLDLPQLAWQNLDGMLSDGLYPDVSAYVEGHAAGNEMLPFRNGAHRRGWLDIERAFAGNMPHNWTSAEMLMLLRDMLVAETGGEIVLGLGVHPTWLQRGNTFGVRNLPTDRGEVSYTATVHAGPTVSIEYEGPRPYRLAPGLGG